MNIGMVTADCTDPGAEAAFWTKALGVNIVENYEEFVMIGSTPVLGFQKVDDPTPGKNRMHLDLHSADRLAEVDRLIALGAAVVAEHQMPGGSGFTWTVMRDPEGLEFCVSGQ
ncbi:hypothetical protein SAMN05443377_10517 [Propionibacterium cyclohexanicum]|uniref:Glyoxalase-like domain-containing protein n=1 Tax=Propionibacterium cyclohexanicum TaxID=64702 RepID=A0A1H9QYZ8_9ACTN|nr:VOC family protein [Propionibacterium cyclohexanicum]SER65475.1 hypothetical protein SAMN05443377_10517 [Propionibacterium cyclohexanicum]